MIAALWQEWERPFVLTVTAVAVDEDLELTFRTISGDVAATLRWPRDAKNRRLKEAIVASVECSDFDCPLKPLRVLNLRLVKEDATVLRLGPEDPLVAEQLTTWHAAPKSCSLGLSPGVP